MGTVTLKHDVTNESVADPSTDGDIMDASMNSGDPNNNNSSSPQLFIGKTNCSGKGCDWHRGLFYYDMAQVVPKSAIITAAEWWIYVLSYAIDMGIDGIVTFTAQRIRRNGVDGNTVWVESEVTHSQYNSSYVWGTPGAENTTTDRDTSVGTNLTGLDPGDSGFGGTTAVTDTTLTDTAKSWTVDERVGLTVFCNNKTMLITSNTSDTVIGSGWSGGGNPGDGNGYVIMDIAWWNPSIFSIVKDAQDNREGKVHFRVARIDFINTTGWIQLQTKGTFQHDQRPHLRVTYTLDSKTYQAILL